jgi:hypothetical protein
MGDRDRTGCTSGKLSFGLKLVPALAHDALVVGSFKLFRSPTTLPLQNNPQTDFEGEHN